MSELTAENIRKAVDDLMGATAWPSYSGIIHPFAAKDLFQKTCPCGKPATHTPKVNFNLCDGHWFAYKVAKAAKRLPEFYVSLRKTIAR